MSSTFQEKNIFVFLDNVPFASAGFLAGLAQISKKHVYSFFPHTYQSRRSGVDITTTVNNCFPIDYSSDFSSFVKEHEAVLKEAIFVSFGYLLDSYRWAKRLSSVFQGPLVVISERPTVISRFRRLKLLPVLLKHALYARKEKINIDCLLGMGNIGLHLFHHLGWPNQKLFPFGYCPLPLEAQESGFDVGKYSSFENVFVYSGRLVYRSKSPNRLIRFFRKNPEQCLLVIGDYGDDRDKFFKQVRSLPNVFLLGKRTINETMEIMSKADCVLIPSSVDGWNVNVNLAAMANVPVVITNKCGSDDVVSFFGNGVVCYNSRRSFEKGINHFLQSKETMKSKAKNVKNALSPLTFANYFAEIIDYVLEAQTEKCKPTCPWGI